MRKNGKKILVWIIPVILLIAVISFVVYFATRSSQPATLPTQKAAESNAVATPGSTSSANVKPTVSSAVTPNVSTTAEPTVSTTAEPTVSTTAEPTVSSTAKPTVSSTAEPTPVPTASSTKDADYDSSGNTQIFLNDAGTTVKNNNGGVKIASNGNVYITKAGEYDVSGSFTNKSIIVEMAESDKATLNLQGVSITSSVGAPIDILSADKVEISAINGTKNTITDNRSSGSDATGGAIQSCVDLEIKGKGSLTVISKYNNGIDTNDDLEIKNLTLKVTAPNNALKGNDSVTVESGNITTISTLGDGIKTTNYDVSDTGKQRGIVTILDGMVTIYAACDGVDAAYDAVISGGNVAIYTASYSEYSENVTSTSATAADVVVNPGVSSRRRPGGMGGGMGGGMSEGNPDAVDYSCKGVKAVNSVKISGGTVSVKSYDDSLHAGNVDVSGGTLTLYCNDDAIHGDNTVNISAGKINIQKSYEGVEASVINFKGGTTHITASDDAMNANASNASLNISGGVIYFNAGGDGIDSNHSVVMSGGVVLAQGPSNGGNGVIDYDRSFTFSGGLLLVTGANGMNQKPSAAGGNTVIVKNISTNTNSYITLTVDGEVTAVIKITKNSQSYCVAAYNNTSYGSSGSVSVTTSTSVSLTDGLYYVK